jgi:hypothetical protein
MISDQIPLFSNRQTSKILNIVVPGLPSVIRYTDDFTEKDYSFSSFESDVWPLVSNGSNLNINFEKFSLDPCLKKLIKAFSADRMLRYSVSSVRLHVDFIAHFETEEIIALIGCRPENARYLWDLLRAKERPGGAFDGLKSLIKLVAERSLAEWTPLYLPFISASLPLPSRDKFAAIRSGDVFIAGGGVNMYICAPLTKLPLESKSLNSGKLTLASTNSSRSFIRATWHRSFGLLATS